ncbi:hypothetical protein BaRGS_00012224 [Batillaria attramentaria]|uniref:Uncharacterized protein n=1 Tax=Batillaria attramentaria TaxID=370345 RepID=A0ABD0LC66_9CAEN
MWCPHLKSATNKFMKAMVAFGYRRTRQTGVRRESSLSLSQAVSFTRQTGVRRESSLSLSQAVSFKKDQTHRRRIPLEGCELFSRTCLQIWLLECKPL